MAEIKGAQPLSVVHVGQEPQDSSRPRHTTRVFPKGWVYLGGAIPSGYVCANCEATGCKLWREYQTFAPKLLCAKCAGADQKRDVSSMDANGTVVGEHGLRTDSIGWYVPAVPSEDGIGYWGYTSVPEPGCRWWKNLLNHPNTQ